MENVKQIRNDELVQAYQTMHQNNTTETQQAVTRQEQPSPSKMSVCRAKPSAGPAAALLSPSMRSTLKYAPGT